MNSLFVDFVTTDLQDVSFSARNNNEKNTYVVNINFYLYVS